MFVDYYVLDENTTLTIEQAVYTRDTGAYKCKASNSAGTGQDIATVFIENDRVPKYTNGKYPSYGYTSIIYGYIYIHAFNLCPIYLM